MTVEPADIEQAISNLNDIIADSLGDGDEFRQFSLRAGSDGFQQWIEFLGEAIWTSEEDPRAYDEDKDEHEPLEDYLLGRVRAMCATAQTLSERLAKLTQTSGKAETGLIPLNDLQKRVIEEWAPDADLWGDTPARRLNLTTFARAILKAS